MDCIGDNCNNICSCRSDSECDFITGNCSCEPGYTGSTCHEPCQSGYYGNSCSEESSVILMEQRNVTTSTEPAIALTCGLGISVKNHLVSIDSSVCAHDVLSKSSVSHL